jgi:two-component system phosphate regulon response regulator OmpR
MGCAKQDCPIDDDDSTGNERAIDVQIDRLRHKIEIDPANPLYLQTVRKHGRIYG